MIQSNSSVSKNRPQSILFHADSSDPDMLYFSSFNAIDPYLAFSVGRKKYGVSPASEYGRMVAESGFDEILLLQDLNEGAAKRFKLPEGQQPDTCQVVRHLAKLYRIPSFRIGARFPAGLAAELQEAGLKLEIDKNDSLFPKREIKTATEIAALRKGNRASAAGFRVVAKTLAESKISGGKLVHQGKVLTSERLRELISHAALEEGAVALNTVASCGDQVCDNHSPGHGPIMANELIIVDIFPRRPEDGYWGDMTRTFLKGKASDAQRRLVRTVKRGHDLAISMIKPGQVGGKVHDAVQAFFDKEGYETVRDSKTPKGFFHALGHGIGLEVHESPIIRAAVPWKFKKGQVVTVEPGLYYLGLGGVRIEDVIHLVPGGNEKISKAPYKWEIA
ncbi:MAG: Xaa-Pro aminopeptidase [Paracoccaceae bacterium]|jgi:Xaa-Pro aminopeptidase